MMMVKYLLDADEEAIIPGVAGPKNGFADIVEPVAVALEQERKVTKQIEGLAGVAREHGDFQSEQFIQWFLKEQVEEVATMSDLLRTVERARENPMWAEEYLAREHGTPESEDPTAPSAAGGVL
jgi:ferritin